MKHIVLAVSGIIAVLIGLGFVMPAAARLRDPGALPGPLAALLALGLSLTTAGMVAGLRRRKS